MSPSRNGGLNLKEAQFSWSPNSDYMNSLPSIFVVGRGFENDRGSLSIPHFPDMSCGYDFVQSNGDGYSFLQKDGRREMGVRINNSFVGSPSPRLEDVICALQKYLPSNNEDKESLPAVDAYSCDEFRIYEFKVRRGLILAVGLQKFVLNRQIPGHRRHLDRISSMPSEASRGLSSSRLVSLSDTSSQQPMVELTNSLQSLRLKDSSVPSWLQVQAQMVNGGTGHGSPRASNLRHCLVQSIPCTPTRKTRRRRG